MVERGCREEVDSYCLSYISIWEKQEKESRGSYEDGASSTTDFKS